MIQAEHSHFITEPSIDLREIETYLRCPRLHWFRYHLGLRGARDTGYHRFHQGVYAVMSTVVEDWNESYRVSSDRKGHEETFALAWKGEHAVHQDGRDLYRRARAEPAVDCFMRRLNNLEKAGRSVKIILKPVREFVMQLPSRETGEVGEKIRIIWSAGHAETDQDDNETAVYLHKFSRRKASHNVQADHFALTLLPETAPNCVVGLWYLLIDPEPDGVVINPKSRVTARSKVEAAALNVLNSRRIALDGIRPHRCDNDDTCRSCAYRFNCFDGND